MADRFPLILNTSTNQIQEIPSGDNLDLTGVGINNVGVITSGNVQIGAATTDLIVTGDARITGILTVGTDSITLNETANTINVGTALTLGHTQGLQFHTQNLHSAGFEVNQINVSGVATATTFKGDGDFVDLDVDGHTNLDNVSIAGITTMSGNLNVVNTSPFIDLTDTDHNSDYKFLNDNGTFKIRDMSNSNAVRYQLGADGKHYIYGDTAVMGSSNLTVGGNLSVGGVLTYEDVTNVDSIGIITARNGINVSSGTATFQGAIDANGDLDVDGHTNLDNVSVAGVSTYSGAATFNGTVNSNAALNIGANSHINLATGNWAGNSYGKIQHHANRLYLGAGSNADPCFVIRYDGTDRIFMTSGGTLYPVQDSNSDLGKPGLRWANIYGDTLYGDGSNLTGIDTDLVSDTSPQLGGDLDTNSHHILLDDSHAVKWGNSTELEIQHTGSSGYAAIHNAVGNFVLDTTGNFYVRDTSGAKTSILADPDGATTLYYDNSPRLNTQSAGINVTGRVTADDLTIENTSGNLSANFTATNGLGTLEIGGSTGAFIDLKHPSTDDYDARLGVNGTNGYLNVINNFTLTTNGKSSLYAAADSSTKLYCNGTEKLSVDTSTVNIKNGGLSVNRSNAAHAGAIYFSGTDTNHMLWQDHWDNPQGTRQNSGTFDGIKWNCYDGLMLFRGNEATNIASFLGGNNGCELYHNNVKRFETTAEGFKMTQSNNYFDFPGGMILRGTGSGWNTRCTTTFTGSTDIFNVRDHADASVFNVKQDSYVGVTNNYNFYIGTFDQSYSSSDGVRFMPFGGGSWMTSTFNVSTGTNTPGPYIYNRNASHNGVRFYVRVNGGVVNHSGNNSNLCDERMKKNIVDAPSYWNSIKNIGIKKFNYNSDPEGTPLQVGVIAQQVETIESDLVDDDFAVDGSPNDEGTTMMKSVHEEQLFMMAVKALQEAQARIETLEAEVAALKGS